ncbi:hypothetical protein AAMO2058_000520100 [Amorphochlora amoebiformis]
MELILLAVKKKLSPFVDSDFAHEMKRELKAVKSWIDGKEIKRKKVRAACQILYDSLEDEELESLEQLLHINTAAWGYPNKLAGHVLNLTDVGMHGLFELWTELVKGNHSQPGRRDSIKPILNQHHLHEILFYQEHSGKNEDKDFIKSIDKIPYGGYEYQMWQDRLLKLASIRGYNIHVHGIVEKTMRERFHIRKKSNEIILEIIQDCDGLNDIRQVVEEKLATFSEIFDIETLELKKLVLTDCGITPNFVLSMFMEFFEYIILEFFGNNIKNQQDLIAAVSSSIRPVTKSL